MHLNVSWRSTPELAELCFQVLMLILNDNEWQVLHGKGTKRYSLVYPIGRYANERSFVLVWKVTEANRCEKSTFFSQISVVVDLHEGSGTINQQVIANLTFS